MPQLWQLHRLSSIILALALLTCFVSSCDFLRSLAGRPGSEDIARKRALIAKAEQRRDSLAKARLDSIARIEQAARDSIAAMDTLTRAGKLFSASQLKHIQASTLDHRYYVVAGVFADKNNAQNLISLYAEDGYQTIAVKCRKTADAVLVAPSNRISEILESYLRIEQLPYSSKHLWVLVNE